LRTLGLVDTACRTLAMAFVTAWTLLALTTGRVAIGLAARRARLARRALLREKQRRIALHQLRQRGGDVHRRHVLLALVALDQGAELARPAGGQRVGDARQELLHATVVHRFHAGQLHLFDRLARCALDRAQHALLARGDEQDGVARAAGTAGAADAVHVALGVVRDVV